jgi:RpiB/LacA/LacB family sugar-phosphate isomerase
MLFIGSDHGGLEMKEELVKVLASRNQPVKDCGTTNGDSVDYPDFAEKVAGAVSRGEAELGILGHPGLRHGNWNVDCRQQVPWCSCCSGN